jgi:Major capsid protein 13-like
MALSNMQVFNQYIMPGTMEILGQMIDKFNAASGGTIRLTSEGFDGNYTEESFFQGLASARRRVNRNIANGVATETPLVELKRTEVKIAGGFGPIVYEPSQFTWLQRPTSEGVAKASGFFAQVLLQDQLNTAIAALVAAIANQPTATNDESATKGANYSVINNAHAKFGDNSQNIRANVMSGATFHKMIGANLANAPQLFQAGNVTVTDILGRLHIVTDAPALTIAGTPTKEVVLGLVTDACTVSDPGDVISNIETKNGKLRIETTMQVDYTFGLGLKGYTWDVTNGGASPSDAALATGTNWDKIATDIKHTAGVVALGDVAKV